MEQANQAQPFDRSSPGEGAIDLHNLMDQPSSPKDERVVSANPSLDAAITSAPTNAKDQIATSETTGSLSNAYPFNAYMKQEQGIYCGGYHIGTGDEHTNYVSANNLHVMPSAMYSFDAQMGYGQYSAPIMIDGHLYSIHQIPVPPSYYPPEVSPSLPHVTSDYSVSQAELMAQGSNSQQSMVENRLFGPGSGFYIPFGSFGGGELSGNSGFYNYQGEFGSGELLSSQSSALDSRRYLLPMTSGAVYPPSVGMYGSYEQNVAQLLQQASFHGLGLGSSSSSRHGPSNYVSGSSSLWETSQRNRLAPERGGRRERDCVSVMLGIYNDQKRGPRASKMKSKSATEEGSSSVIQRYVDSSSGIQLEQYNRPDFATDYEDAKFFVMKCFSEDNVHRSIKYNIWSSTTLGNRKLDAAYREAKEKEKCPVFLVFSVNGSGQFCGVAEMVGTVDFENDAKCWQQNRWSGQFPVKWHIIKDVPSSLFRHIVLENNDNNPVTYSRDSQEVKLDQGIGMLRIFAAYVADTSLLDDFTFYDEREKVLLEKRAKQCGSSIANAPLADSVNQLSDNLNVKLNLEVKWCPGHQNCSIGVILFDGKLQM